ncbi:ribonuclease HII [Hyella patelloides]|nr:ribonuclease HII [Hyella patelloides]
MNQNICFESSFLPEDINQDVLVAGVDEVGRGALFGSVVAAAVVLPLSAIPQLIELGVKDSKQLSPKKRHDLIKPIKNVVTHCHISEATIAEIDELNILQASLLAMKRAVLALKPSPDICLVDGKFVIPNLAISQTSVIKGDRQSSVIAAASILAKVWRDDLIINLASQYPEYDLAKNKGYPTAKHRLALQNHGVSSQHRKSFAPCRHII